MKPTKNKTLAISLYAFQGAMVQIAAREAYGFMLGESALGKPLVPPAIRQMAVSFTAI